MVTVLWCNKVLYNLHSSQISLLGHYHPDPDQE